jgi:hypothetical protein
MNHVIKPNERPVVILSTGRAGSTLLQKLLNTHEELVIWGEHDGFLNSLMQSWITVSRSKWIPDTEPSGDWLLGKNRPLNVDKWTAWDGSFSKQAYNSHLKGFIDNIFSEHVPVNVRWGFKEIRYRNIELMNFWSALYPETQYILLMRNPIDSCLSFTTANANANAAKEGVTTDDFKKIMNNVVEKQIKPVFNFFREAMTKFENSSRAVIFDNLVDDTENAIDGLDSFLELGSRFDSNKISEIIGKDIMSQRKETSDELRQTLSAMAEPLLKRELEWFEELLCNSRKL